MEENTQAPEETTEEVSEPENVQETSKDSQDRLSVIYTGNADRILVRAGDRKIAFVKNVPQSISRREAKDIINIHQDFSVNN